METDIAADPFLELECTLGEGPVWIPAEERLSWVDIIGAELHGADADGGAHRVTEVGTHVSAIAARAEGGVVLAVKDGFELRTAGRQLERIIPVPVPDGQRFNDGSADPRGRFLAGTMAYDETKGVAALYRLEPDGSVGTVLSDVSMSNGIVWSADGRSMYYVDSPTQRVDVFDYDGDAGTVGNRRTVVAIEPADGTPDGLAIDSDGCLWLCLHGGGAIRRYAPSGEHLGTVRLPVPTVTACAFGGAALDILYITTARQGVDVATYPLAGSVFVARPGVAGAPEHAYAG